MGYGLVTDDRSREEGRHYTDAFLWERAWRIVAPTKKKGLESDLQALKR